MNKTRTTLLTLACLMSAGTLSLTGCGTKPPEAEFLQRLTDQVIVPQYASLQTTSTDLAQTLTQYCDATATAPTLAQVQQQWLNTMDAWQTVQPIQFGPVRDKNLGWEMQFWPDKKNLTAKKVQQLLNSQDALDEPRLQKASVVVRGLPAIEYLLFDETLSATTQAPRQCQLLRLTADHIQATSAQLRQGWSDDYQHTLLNPGPDNAQFPEALQAVAVVIDSYMTQLEQIKDRKLAQPLGIKTSKQRLNAYQLESWRSQHSRANVRNNISSIATLMNEGGFYDYLVARDQQTLADDIQSSIAQTLSAINASDTSLFIELSNADSTNLQAMHDQLTGLLALFKTQLPAALNIQLGFNNNDGD